VSRKDNQIKHMGHRIELGEIEAVVSKHNGVLKACSVYVESRSRIVLYYIGDAQTDDVAEFLEEMLPRYMRPYKVVHLDEMPLTTSGKIGRKALKDRAQNECGKRKRKTSRLTQ
jgi:acyl-coenzyme A synthetase/AMP-(fatty) acid ligase